MGDRLQGKVAIITGAARGQGEAEVRAFVEEGARVVFTDVLDEQGHAVAASLGGDVARFVHHDVSDETAWASVIGTTVEAFGGLHVLVNNAGIHWVQAIEDETVEGFERLFRVNLLGTFLGIRSAIAPMRDSGGGSIVNISSAAGLTGYAWHGGYGATKWGVRGLTKVAAVELGPDGIRVNSVHPGPIETDMLPPDREGLGQARFSRLPLRRSGTPDEVADLVVFLASDESAYVSGAEITIDGGSLAGPPHPPRPPKRG